MPVQANVERSGPRATAARARDVVDVVDVAVEQAHFIVLGVGGLGCPAALALVAAGARRLTLVDDDRVDASNLQRQVLFTTADVGMAKTLAARVQLRARAPELQLVERRARLDARALEDMLDETDPARGVVLECSDDPQLKFAANDAALARGIPLVIAGVQRWRGQLMAITRGAACYRCVYEAPPPRELAPRCSAVGIMGSVAGLFGHWMAAVAVRLAAGARAEAGTLHAIDLRDMRVQSLRPRPRPGCPACALRGPERHAPAAARCQDQA